MPARKATTKQAAKKTTAKTAKTAKSLKKGDAVTWSTSQGDTHGTVERKLTSPTRIKGHEVAASPANPEYLVKSDKTGAEAAHKASALRKTRKRAD